MRNGLTLVCLLCCWFGVTLKTIAAQAPATSGQICSPAVLDVSALPAPPSFTYGGHLFVLELKNISPAACSLQSPQVALMPASDTNNQPFYAAWRAQDPGYKTESQPQVLEAGAWAHLLFAWTSRVSPELNCDQYSGLRLGFAYRWTQRKEPEIEIRHLWIRACGPFAVTGYRLGKYSKASPVPQSWLDWYIPDGLHDFTVPLPTSSTEVATDSPLVLLSARAKRTMLGDPLFSLKLNFPRLVAQGCAYSQLRKRESDGSTVISIQQCEDVAPDESAGAPAVPPNYQAGVVGLAMGNLDFTPKHFGPIEYDITARVDRGVGQKAALHYARTQVDLMVRDPALPRQAAILDPLPACTAGQLRMDSLSPVISTPLKTLRAYNATNISPQACSLAGVPRTRGLDAKGDYQSFRPPACPNCENEFFMPRPNGRIDLHQGEAAHLLAGTSGDATGYCNVTPGLEVSFDRDASLTEPLNTRPLPEQIAQSAAVPFQAHDCVSIDISAWRQGAYDGDPLNLHTAKLASPSEPAPMAPIPSECNKPALLAHGQPHPIEGTHNPEYELSMDQHEFVRDQPIPLYLWMNNSSDSAIELGSCTVPAYLKAGGFVLYDAYGHRILNKRQIASDERCKADPSGYYASLMCTVSGSFTFPAHTCVSSPVDLANDYELPPGEYTISTRDPGDSVSCPRRVNKTFHPNPATDITFKVLQP